MITCLFTPGVLFSNCFRIMTRKRVYYYAHTTPEAAPVDMPDSGQKQGRGDERLVNIQQSYRISSEGQAEIQTRHGAAFVIYLEGMWFFSPLLTGQQIPQ